MMSGYLVNETPWLRNFWKGNFLTRVILSLLMAFQFKQTFRQQEPKVMNYISLCRFWAIEKKNKQPFILWKIGHWMVMTNRKYNLKCLHYQFVFSVHVSPTIMLNTLRHWGHDSFTSLKKEGFMKWLYLSFKGRVTQSFWWKISVGCFLSFVKSNLWKVRWIYTPRKKTVAETPRNAKTATNTSHAKS